MSTQANRRQPRPPADEASAPAVPSFTPVAVRPRKDGWTPERQVGFIQALAATGCVEEAAAHVGMTARSARDLRTRRDAASLRAAWDAAIAAGVHRLEEAAMSRAIHGVAVPIFHKGEQVGERRRFDERLTAFLLRYHAGHRYGAWRDRITVERRHPDGAAMLFAEALARLVADCVADATGAPRARREPLAFEAFADDPAVVEREEAAATQLREMRRNAEWDDFQRQLAAERARWEAEARAEDRRGSSAPDGSSGPAPEGPPTGA